MVVLRSTLCWAALLAVTAVHAQSPVLIGLPPRQCNALGNRNLDGKVVLAGDQNLQNSPQDCCAACKADEECNVWNWCSAPEGCDDGGKYKQCWLRQDWAVWDKPSPRSTGYNWISGYVSTHCPGAGGGDKLLYLQRVSFASMSSPCQIGSSCTACMCQLSKALKIAQSDQPDAGLCLRKTFRTALMFPLELGGSGLGDAAMDRLAGCPVADPPCQDQKTSTVFASWPLVMPSYPGTDLNCLNTDPSSCAKLCIKTAGCDAFSYNTFQSGGKCCLKSGPSNDTQLNVQGWQMYWKLPAGVTAEDGIFQEWNPWTNGASGSQGSTTTLAQLLQAQQPAASPAVTSAPTIGAAPSAAESTTCTDTPPPGSGYSCQQQASWGKCGFDWMQGYCNLSCGRCSTGAAPTAALQPWTAPSTTPAAATCACTDVNPNIYLCEDEARWGKCGYGYITKKTPDVPEGFCQISCGRCDCDLVRRCQCTDVPPTPWYTCKQQRDWGHCNESWVARGDSRHPQGFCQVTCGRCGC